MRWWKRLTPETRTSVYLLVGSFVLFFITANRGVDYYANDTLFVSQPAWTLGTLGTLDISGFEGAGNIRNWTFEYNGGVHSDRFPGAILWVALFYGIAQPGQFTMVPSALAAALACAISVFALHRVLLTIVRPRIALGGAVLLGLGTSVWTVASDAIWTEGPVIMAVALAMWALTRERWWLAGLAYAFGILTRPHTAVFAAAAGIWEGVRRRSLVPVLQVGLASALGFVGLLVYNRINSGQFDIFPGSYGGRIEGAVTIADGYGQARGSEWLADYSATFFSPLRGLFVYSPFILLVLPGLVRAWRKAPSWVRSSAVGSTLYLVVQLAGNSWFGGGYFFGYRLVIPALMGWWPLLTLAYQEWTDRVAWRRYVFAGLAFVSLWWMSQGSLALDIKYIETRPAGLLDWWSWTLPIMLGWSSPLGWVAGALFALLVGALVLLVPDRRPDPVEAASPTGELVDDEVRATATKGKGQPRKPVDQNASAKRAPAKQGGRPKQNPSTKNRKKKR